MTEEQLERIAGDYDLEDLLEILGLTKEEVLVILYKAGMVDEEALEELCPL